MKAKHRRNLEVLRDSIVQVPQEFFDMKFYRSDKGIMPVDLVPGKECGTLGCALGWVPFMLGIEGNLRFFDEGSPLFRGDIFYWSGYSYLLFGLRQGSVFWGWVFASRWTEIDNTPEGVAYRIDILLNDPDKILKEYHNDPDAFYSTKLYQDYIDEAEKYR